jgi:signal peptidase I
MLARTISHPPSILVYTVPPGDLFVMGDSRDNSEDSRFMDGPVGYVRMENVAGPADMVFFSIDPRHPFYEFWDYPTQIRWGRIFQRIVSPGRGAGAPCRSVL